MSTEAKTEINKTCSRPVMTYVVETRADTFITNIRNEGSENDSWLHTGGYEKE